MLSDFDYAFAENGLVAYKAGQLLAVQASVGKLVVLLMLGACPASWGCNAGQLLAVQASTVWFLLGREARCRDACSA